MPLDVPSFKSNWQTVRSTDSTGEGDENLQSEFASTNKNCSVAGSFHCLTVHVSFVLKIPPGHIRSNNMNSYNNYFTIAESYGYFWGKYRPAILKLMISSAEGPQEYKFSAYEVRTANPKGKGGFTFTLKFHKGNAVNDIKLSVIAKDLLRVLQQSKKASELSGSSTYEFALDKHFVLHVIKTDIQHEILEDLPGTVTEHAEG